MIQSDIGLFVGRFHAVVVHLPIGIILLGVVFYCINIRKKSDYIRESLPVIFLLATVSSVVSVIFGLLLASKSGFSGGMVFWHKWLGIGVMVVSLFTWLAFRKKSTYSNWLVVTLLGLVLATGHLGGGLTHGENYLSEHAPLFLKTFLGGSSSGNSAIKNQLYNPDSIFIYKQILQPVIIEKCSSCHNNDNMEGGLDLSSLQSTIKGGNSGAAMTTGNLNQSELYNRIILETTNNKFMPVKGVPFTYHEVKLLEFWIQSGAEENLAITDKDIPKDILEIIELHFGFSTRQKSYVEMATIDPASEEIINRLTEIGFLIQPISRNTNFLSVTAADSVTLDQLKQLKNLKNQVGWLDLNRCNIQDVWLEEFLQFPNLTKLNLSENPISTIETIAGNDRLEKINLHSTMIGDTDLQLLIQLKNLQRLHVWNTSVTSKGMDHFKLKRADVNIE
jgi:uncharacterized membrane protein